MVLGVNVMKIFSVTLVRSMQNKLLFTVFGFCFFISSCHSEIKVGNFDYLTTVKVEKLKLELSSQKDRCSIRLNNLQKGELLDIPYPCGFVRAGETEIVAQTYHYDGVGHVFVVAGPIAEKEAYSKNSGVSFKHMCSNQGQVVIVQNGKLVLRKSQNVPLGFCHYLGFDEKDYYGFAYPVD